MSDLPNGWNEYSFMDILDIQGGSQPPKSKFIYEEKEGYVRFLQIRDFGEKPHVTFIPFSKTNKVCNDDDILIARYGASIGRICTGMSGAYNVAMAKVIIPDTIYKRYVYYLLKSHIFQNEILRIERSAQDGFNKDDLEKIMLPFPATTDEQQKIVDRLELLLGKISTANERLNNIPTILKRFRQSVLSAACSGRLTEDWRNAITCGSSQTLIDERITSMNKQNKKQYVAIDIGFDFIKSAQTELPETWLWTAIANYATCSRGRFSIRPRNDPRCYDGDYPFIQIGDLPREGGLINNHKQTLNDFGLKTSKMFPKGTVVIAIVGATIANTGILNYDMCFPDSMVGIETGTEVGNKYIEYYLRLVKEDIRQISYAGGGQPNIKLETLEPYPMPLPPLPEQEEIVRRVDKLFALADKIEERYSNVKRQLERAERAIYAKAFRGEL
jgi:type I restriction enzyme S subunit